MNDLENFLNDDVVEPVYNVDINELRNALHNGLVQVTFIKVDGSERVMDCSLNSSYLPEVVVDPTAPVKKERKVSPDVISVYEPSSKAWKSFRKDSVTSFSVLSEVTTFE